MQRPPTCSERARVSAMWSRRRRILAGGPRCRCHCGGTARWTPARAGGRSDGAVRTRSRHGTGSRTRGGPGAAGRHDRERLRRRARPARLGRRTRRGPPAGRPRAHRAAPRRRRRADRGLGLRDHLAEGARRRHVVHEALLRLHRRRRRAGRALAGGDALLPRRGRRRHGRRSGRLRRGRDDRAGTPYGWHRAPPRNRRTPSTSRSAPRPPRSWPRWPPGSRASPRPRRPARAGCSRSPTAAASGSRR